MYKEHIACGLIILVDKYSTAEVGLTHHREAGYTLLSTSRHLTMHSRGGWGLPSCRTGSCSCRGYRSIHSCLLVGDGAVRGFRERQTMFTGAALVDDD